MIPASCILQAVHNFFSSSDILGFLDFAYFKFSFCIGNFLVEVLVSSGIFIMADTHDTRSLRAHLSFVQELYFRK